MSWKAAKKPYTKAQKRQRTVIREEFEWVLELANRPGHPMNPGNPAIQAWGGTKWLSELMRLNDEYKAASDGRDELLNNSMLMLASLDTKLYRKMLDSPKSLTITELGLVYPFLKRAQEEASVQGDNNDKSGLSPGHNSLISPLLSN